MRMEKPPRVRVWCRVFACLLALAVMVGSRPAAAAPTPPAVPDVVGWQQFGTTAINDGKSLNAVAGTPAGEFWAVGDGGEVWHYNQGAVAWTRVPLAAGVTYADSLNSVYPVPGVAGQAWVVGNAAGIFYCTTTVCNQETAPGTTHELDSIWMTSATDAWIVGSNGTILHFVGGSWQNVLLNPALTAQLHNVQMLNAGEGYAVGEAGTILHYTTANGWLPVTGATGSLIGLWFIAPNEGWIVGGANGGPAITYHYLNGVLSPEATAPETANTRLWYVYMLPDRTGWAVANGGYIIHRDITGWHLAYTGAGGPPVFGVWMSSAVKGWAVAGNGAAYLYSGGNGPLDRHIYLPSTVR